VYEKWGTIACDPSAGADARVFHMTDGGGDWRPTGPITDPREPQGNTNWRKVLVEDGDDSAGERCEFGYNSFDYGDEGVGDLPPGEPTTTFALYREGEHHLTVWSVFLPEDFPLDVDNWQVIGQQKQTGGSNVAALGGVPVVSVEARQGFEVHEGRVILMHNAGPVWETPITLGIWTRIQIEGYYHPDPDRGWMRMTVDSTPDEGSDPVIVEGPVIHEATLLREIEGDLTAVPVGTGAPSHLRMGIYHDPLLPGTWVGVDNVQHYLVVDPAAGPGPLVARREPPERITARSRLPREPSPPGRASPPSSPAG
jgi:hypothetical protein